MTREEAKEVLQEQIYKCWCESDEKGIDALNVAISLLCQQPGEDCISRAEALKHSHIEYDDEGEGHRVVYVEDIEDLPPVTPEQIKGQWLEVIDDTDSSGRKKNWHYKCSICGNEDSGWGEYNYCPICGAEMKGMRE